MRRKRKRGNYGKDNGRYIHGKCCKDYHNYCINCNKEIDRRSKRCCKCRSKFNNSFKGKHHTKKTKKIIGKKSKAKFTKKYKNKLRKRYRGNKKRDINGYILIKDYNHPNRNFHNDILEHIKIISEKINRPLKKGEVVHHINFIRNDNRIENLYLYASTSEHLKASKGIFKLIDILLKNNIIEFKNGKYQMKRRKKVQRGGKL